MSSEELDFTTMMLSNGKQNELQVPLDNSPWNPNPTSNTMIRFKVSADVYNWSKSYIDFDVQVTAAADLGAALFLNKNQLIQNISLQYDGCAKVVDYSNADLVSCVTLAQMKQKDYESRPNHTCNFLAAEMFLERTELYGPTRRTSSYTVNNVGEYAYTGKTFGDLSGSGGAAYTIDRNGTIATATITGMVPGDNAPAVALGTPIAAAAAGLLVYKIRINLGDLKNTLLAVNKTLYWPRQAQLEITFNPTQQWGFRYTSGAVGANLAFAASDVLSQVVTVLTARPVQLYMAVERNEKLRQLLTDNTTLGISLNIPYIKSYPQSISVGQGTANCSLDQNAGSFIKRVYTVFYRNGAGVRYHSTCNTVAANAGALVPANTNNIYNSIRTTVGSIPQQLYVLNCISGDDYQYLRKTLEGCPLSSQAAFQNMSFFVDNFTDPSPSCTWDDTNCDIGGLPTVLPNGSNLNIQYSVQASINAMNGAEGAVGVCFIVVGTKTLMINSTGMDLK